MGNASSNGRQCSDSQHATSLSAIILQEARSRVAKQCGERLLHQHYHIGDGRFQKDYTMTRQVLGFGVSGNVFLAHSRKNGRRFAVKSLDLTGKDRSSLLKVATEMEIMLTLDHPGIVRLADVYETDSKLHLVMECMQGGELFDRLVQCKRFSEEYAKDVLWQMLATVAYLHKQGVAHRDLKPENFLYEEAGGTHLKLIDFGLSELCDSSAEMSAQVGTVSYTAPEVFRQSYTCQCDIWSLGICAFMFLAGYTPFAGSIAQQKQDITKGNYAWKANKWEQISSGAIDFVKSLLALDATERPTAKGALQHSWLAGRAQTSIPQSVHVSVLESIRNYQSTSKFRQACLNTIAHSLTQADIGVVRSYFLHFDASHHGVLDTESLRQMVSGSTSLSENEIRELLKDIDDDKPIRYSDFLAALVPSLIKPRREVLLDAFQRFDGDSCLSSRPDKEYITPQALQSLFEVDKEQASTFIGEADQGQCGQVSFTDFSIFVQTTPLPRARTSSTTLPEKSKEHPAEGKEKKRNFWKEKFPRAFQCLEGRKASQWDSYESQESFLNEWSLPHPMVAGAYSA
jgi:calcium-dependent protein kinase